MGLDARANLNSARPITNKKGGHRVAFFVFVSARSFYFTISNGNTWYADCFDAGSRTVT
jgi:hypothetical protein